MQFFSRIAFWCCTVAGLSLLTAGIVLGIQARRSEFRGALKAEAPTQSFGERPSDTEVVLPFTLINDTNREAHIIGAREECRALGCVSCDDLPLAIPPGSRAEVKVRVALKNYGPEPAEYYDELVLYTDLPGQTEFPLRMEGRVLGRAANPEK
jgi:hypothetical protein